MQASIPDAEAKIEKLRQKANKIRPTVATDKREEKIVKPDAIKIGDAVRMKETSACGEVVEIKDKVVIVEAGSLRFRVAIDKIEWISRAELKKSIRSIDRTVVSDPVLTSRKMNFKPEIDIRGVRAEEAINRVRDLIDSALMVQHSNLRILHGKGNGILREVIRNYLSSNNIVKSFRDEHVDMGGSGITVVELDF